MSAASRAARKRLPFAPMVRRSLRRAGRRASRRSVASALLASALLLSPQIARAATDTWTGNGDGNWMTASDWGGTVPSANDILNFAGLLSLVTNNNFTAGTQFNGLTFASGAGAFTLNGNSIKLGGNVTNSSSNLQTINLATALTVNSTWDTGTGGITTGSAGNITGAFVLTKNGTGTLTINGTANTLATILAHFGTIVLNATSSTTTTGYNSFGQASGDNATVTIAGTSAFTGGGDFNVSDVSGSNGILNISTTGTVKGVTTYVGKSGTSTGVVNQSNGTYQQTGTSDFHVGGNTATDTASVGTWNLSGGTLTATSNVQFGVYGTGYLNQTGGAVTFTGGYIDAGRYVGSYGVIDVSGGTFLQGSTGTRLFAGEAGYGVITVRGTGTITANGGITIGNGTGTGSGGIVNVDTGGVLTAAYLSMTGTNAGNSYLNFNGGTLRPTVASTTFITNLTAANIFSSGAIIDTNSLNITIPQALLAPAGSGLSSVTITSGGSGYQTAPVIKITGGGGVGATAVATVTNGVITGITITSPGTGYTSAPTVTVVAGSNAGYAGGSGATFTTAIAANTSGGLTKNGAGTLTLTGANTYAGGTTLNAGTLAIASDAPLGAVPGTPTTNLTFGGGTLQPTATFSLSANRNLTINSASTATFLLGANTLTIPGAITSTGTGIVLQTTNGDTGALVLSGANSFASGASVKLTGGTGTSGGILRLANSNALGTNALTINDTFGNNASLSMVQLSGGITIPGTVTLAVAGHNAGTTNDDQLRNFAGNNTFNGIFDITTGGGGYYIDSAVSGSTLTMGGAIRNDVGSSVRGPVFYGAGNTTVTGAIANGSGTTAVYTGDATHANTGVVLLSGNNTYTGGTTAYNGTLRLGSTTALPTGTALTIGAAGTLDLNGQFQTSMGTSGAGLSLTTLGLTSGGTINFDLGNGAADQLTFTGAATTTGGKINISLLSGLTSLIPGSYTLISDTAGDLSGFTLANTNITLNGLAYSLSLNATTNSDILTISNGVLGVAYWTGSQDNKWNTGAGTATNFSIDAAGANNTIALPNSSTDVFFTANSAANLNTTLGQDFTINSLTFTGTGTAAGTSSITIGGANTLTLNAIAGTYAAGTGIVVNTGSAAHTISANVGLGNSQSWTNNSTSLLTVSGAVSGSNVTLTTAGTGAIALSGANTYTGGTNVSAGTLTLGNASALGAATNTLAVSGGTIDFSGLSLTQSALTLSGGVIASTGGGGSLTLSSPGTAINIANTGNNFAYPATTVASPVNITLSGATGGNIVKTTAYGNPVLSGNLDLGGVNRVIALADTSGDAAGELALTGIISDGALSLTNNATGLGVTMANQADWGTLLLTNANTYAGGTNINFGRIVIANGSALGTGTVTIAQATTSGGTLAFGNTGYTSTIANGIIATGITLPNNINLGGAINGDYAAGIQNNSGANTISGTVTLTNSSSIINVGGGSLTIGTNIGQTSTSALTKTGANFLYLNGANTYTGVTTISGGDLSVAILANGGIASGIGASSNAVGNLVLNGGILQYTGANTSTDRGYTMNAVSGGGIDTTNNLTIGGQVVSAATSATAGVFTKYGAGTLTFTNTASTNTYDPYTGGIGFNNTNGTVVFDTLGDTSQVNVINGEFATGTTTGTGATGANTVINGGTTTVGTYVSVARGNGNTGLTSSLTLNGGTLTSANAAFGYANGVTGFNATGNVTLNNAAIWNDTGLMNVAESAGGTVTLTINGTSALNVDTAGTAANNLFVGKLGTGTLTMNGGAVTTGVSLIVGNGTGAVGTVNLNAGVLTAPSISTAGGASTFNFNGGTLKASAASTTFMTGLTAANILSGGATINTNTFNDTIVQALLNGGGTDGGLTKIGTGTLTLSGANTYNGGTTINAGTLSLGSASAIGSTGTITFGGGTLQFSTANTTDYSSRINANDASAISIDTNGQNVTFSSALGSGDTGGLTKLGTGVLALTGANSYSGGTTLTAGSVNYTTLGNLGTGTINFNGGTLQNATSNTIDPSARFNTTNTSAVSFDTNGNNVSFATLLGSGDTGGLAKLGAGILTLTGLNTYTGGTTITGGELSILADNYLGSGTLTFNGGLIQYTGATESFSPTVAFTANGGGFDVANAGTTLTEAQALTDTGLFSKTGAGTLILTGATNTTGNFFPHNGVLLLPNGTSVTSTGYISIAQSAGDNGTLTLTGNATYTGGGDFNVSDLANSNGTLNIGGTAAVKGVTTYVGKTGNATGTVNQTGGSYTQTGGGDFRIGGTGSATDASAVGVWNISAGTLTTPSNFQVGSYGNGALNISGTGAVTTTVGYPVIGRFGGSYGVMDVSGGSFTHNATGTLLIVGEQGTGVLNVRGGSVTSTGTGGLLVGGTEGTTGTVGIVNLNSGTLTVNKVSTGSANDTSTFNFNGGTLQSTSNSTAFFTGLTNAYVYSGGAVINTNGNNDTIAQNLLAPTGNGLTSVTVANGGSGYQTTPLVQITGGGGTGATAVASVVNGVITGITITNPGTGYTSAPTVTLIGGSNTGYAGGSGATFTTAIAANTSGGLTKNGSGTLTLTGANTYTGGTTINAGTVAASGTALGTGLTTIASGATLSVGEAVNSQPGVGITVNTLNANSLAVTLGSTKPLLTFNLGASGINDVLNLTGSGNELTYSGSGAFVIGFGSATGSVLGPGTYTLLTFATAESPTVAPSLSSYQATPQGNLVDLNNPSFAYTTDGVGNITALTFSFTGADALPEPSAVALLLAGVGIGGVALRRRKA